MTAQELAAMLRIGCKLEKSDLANAAAMILQQAEQIEALTKERDGAYVQSLQFSEENKALLKANLDCFDNFNTLKADYDALKADAERYKWLKANCALGIKQNGNGWSLNTRQCVAPDCMKDLDAAIDAMKGKS